MVPASAIIAIMAEANNASVHSLLWGRSVEFWDRFGIWALVIGAALGVIALVLTSVSAYVLYRVADKAQVELAAESKASAELNRDTEKLRSEAEASRAEIAKAKEQTTLLEKEASVAT